MRAWSVALALGLILLVSPGSAQELRPEMRTRNDLLRSLLFDLEIKPLDSFDDIGDSYKDTLILSLGDPSWLKERPDRFLTNFVMKGGALLLATDHDLRDRVWHQELDRLVGAQVVDAPVVCLDREACYDGKPELPLLQPADEGGPPLLRSLFAERNRVATSLPAHLSLIPRGRFAFGRRFEGNIRPIAYLPRGCVLDRDWREQGVGALELTDEQRLFGVAGQRGQGKIVLLADQHVFINDLMVRADLDNYPFAGDTLSYLAEGAGPDQKRTRCLFLENGQVNNSFEVPLEDLSEFPWEALRREARKLEVALGVMEEKQEFHKAFWNFLARKNITPERLWFTLGGILTFLAGVYLIYRLLRSRAPTETGLPRLSRSVEAQVPTARLMTQRRNEQLNQGRLHEPARHLARTLFLEAGFTPGPTPPTLRIRAGWWERWRTGSRFRRLWKLAFGERPVPVSARQWRGLLADIESIRQDISEGTIQLESGQIA